MEEQNKQSEQETSGAEPKEQGTPTRSSIIMLLAGVYLLYTGYKLCKDVLDGVNGSSWGFFAAGVGFLIVGVVMMTQMHRKAVSPWKRNQRMKNLNKSCKIT